MNVEAQIPRVAEPRRALLFCILFGLLLVAFNQTILTTALPAIAGDLEGIDRSGWLVAGFLLTSTASIPVYGALSDHHGRRPYFLAAVAIFTAASLAAAFATSMDLLIMLRLVQGLGGGGLLVLSQALLADAVPVHARPRYAGLLGTVWAFASLVGPLLGGLFTEVLGWQWCFLVNVPLGTAVLLVAWRALPRHRAAIGAKQLGATSGTARVDGGGILALAVLTAGVVLLTTVDLADSDSLLRLVPLGLACAAALGVLVVVEPRVSTPILPPAVLARRDFILATSAATLSGGIAMFAVIVYLPVHLQLAWGLSATEAGLFSAPMICALLLVSAISGRRAARTGRFRLVTIGGCVASGCGLLLLGNTHQQSGLWVLLLATVVFGAGLGAITQLLLVVVQASSPQALVGTATAATTYIRQVGAAAGIAGVGALLGRSLQSDTAAAARLGMRLESLSPEAMAALSPSHRAIVAAAYHDALAPLFLQLAPFCFAAAVCLLFVKRRSFHADGARRPEPERSVP